MSINQLLLFDFNANNDWSSWRVENDVVMGGKSSSSLERAKEGHAVFKGSVSLENNGGFASLQSHFAPKNIEGYTKAIILVKGDGKNYQFRTKSNLRDIASYIYTFSTNGEWQTIEIPLNKMKPVFRGRDLNIPNFSANEIQELRFLIGNKKNQEFRLEIKTITLE